MIKHAIALRYAKALFDSDAAKGDLEKRLGDFESILKLLDQNPKLQGFLKVPQISLDEKKEVLTAALKDRLDSASLDFLLLLIAEGRWDHLGQIVADYQMMVDDYLGIWEAEIATAVPIGPDVKARLKEKLENFYQKKVVLKKEVDAKIIGGAILSFDDVILDWSIKARLKKIREQLLETHV